MYIGENPGDAIEVDTTNEHDLPRRIRYIYARSQYSEHGPEVAHYKHNPLTNNVPQSTLRE